jgi:hypothetical protein
MGTELGAKNGPQAAAQNADRRIDTRAQPAGKSRRGALQATGVNKLRIRIPWLFEVESDGLIPVVGAFLLCAMVIVWMALR